MKNFGKIVMFTQISVFGKIDFYFILIEKGIIADFKF